MILKDSLCLLALFWSPAAVQAQQNETSAPIQIRAVQHDPVHPTLLPEEAAIEAGKHKLPIYSGVIASVPPVKKVNEYNMAQTNFYYKQREAWTAFAER